MNSVGFTEDVP